MTDTFFYDVSEFQEEDTLPASGLAIVRATDGYRNDLKLAAHVASARAVAQGRLWYMFLVSDVSPEAQAEALLAAVPLEGTAEAYMVDSEEVPWSPWAEGQQLEWTQRALAVLDKATGRPNTQYSDSASLRTMGGPVPGHPSIEAAYDCPEPTDFAHSGWQYTNGVYTSGGYAPVSWPGLGKIDTSVFHGSVAQLLVAFNLAQPAAVRPTGPVTPPPGGHVLPNFVGIDDTPTGDGYWEVESDGSVYTYGDAVFYGSLPGIKVAVSNIVGIAATTTGKGYWLAGSDGGIFAFGDAKYQGGLGGTTLAKPITAIRASKNGGYWLIGSDGGVFAFGAPFEGAPTQAAATAS
jgi:hypothetical protein